MMKNGDNLMLQYHNDDPASNVYSILALLCFFPVVVTSVRVCPVLRPPRKHFYSLALVLLRRRIISDDK
jgi:hypothetical protein